MKRFSLAVALAFLPLLAQALEVGDKAPEVVLEGLTAAGNPHKESILGKFDPRDKFTLLEFFSVHCGACKKSLPKLGKLATAGVGAMTVRLVAVERDAAAVKKYLAQPEVAKHVGFPVSFDTSGKARRAYGIGSVPAFLLLDAQNKVIFTQVGELGPQGLSAIKKHTGVSLSGSSCCDDNCNCCDGTCGGSGDCGSSNGGCSDDETCGCGGCGGNR